MAFDILNQSVNAQVTAAYVGFFGRAPDPAGLNFWIGEYNSNVNDTLAGNDDPSDAETTAARKTALANVASSFATDQEGLETYPFLQTPNLATQQSAANFVNEVFNNLFNRDAEGTADDPTTGLGFWTQEVLDRLTNSDPDFIGTVIVDIMSGAQNEDVQALQNKIGVGQEYATAFANAAGEGAEWTTDDDIGGARAVVEGVDETPGSVNAAQGQIQQIIDEETGAIEPPPSSEVVELTPNADDIDGDNASITVFQGAVGTLTTGDNLDGGTGEGDILDITMKGGENEVAKLSEIELIAVRSLDDGAGTENTLNLNDATGVEEVQVIDKGGDSAGLAINGIDPGSPDINVTGDETIGLKVLDDTGEISDDDANGDEVNVGVNAFDGELNLRNGIETVNLEVANSSDNAFTLSQTEAGTFEQLIVTDEAAPTPPDDGKDDNGDDDNGDDDNGDDQTNGLTPGNTVITSAVASLYDYSASAGNHTLVLTKENPDDAVTVLGGTGEEKVDFTTTMNDIGDPAGPDNVDGGDGNDQVWAQLNTPIDVQPMINNVEAIKLAFVDDGSADATFSASDVGTDSNGKNPVYIIDESTSQVQLLDLADPATVEIIGDLSEGAVFDAADETSIVTRFVTETQEAPSIVVAGDLEYKDFDDVTIQNADSPGFPNPPTGDGQGEVVIENQILLNEASSLTIETTREDDDDADNDGDIVVDGVNPRGNDSAIAASQNLAALTVNAVNGNIFLGDGFVAEDDDALDDASALTDLTVNADNAIASLGDIGEKKPALLLENVNLTGTNRGVINLDDINAADGGKKGGPVVYDGDFGKHPYADGSGALIEDFNVTTAERSFTDTDFRVSGQPIQVANDIDDLEAGLVRNMRLDLAEDGSLSFGEIETNITELNIFGAGDLWMFGEQSDFDFGPMTALSEKARTPWYIEDIQATNHTGDIMLDFRDFAGEDEAFGSTDFEGTTHIRLGDQNTTGTGIRFDSYYASIIVTAGEGDHLGFDDGPGDEFIGSGIAGSVTGDGDNDTLPPFVQADLDDEDALEVAGANHDDTDYFGIVTGFEDDSVTTGSGTSHVFTNAGDDTVVLGGGSDIVDAGSGFNDVTLGTSEDEAADTHVVKLFDKVPFQLVREAFTEEENGLFFEGGYDLVRDFEEGSGDDVTELYGFDHLFDVDPTETATVQEVGSSPTQFEEVFDITNENVEIFEVLFETINIDATSAPNATTQANIEDQFTNQVGDNLNLDGYEDDYALFLVYDNDTQTSNSNAALLLAEVEDVTENEEVVGRELGDVNLLSVYQDVGFGNMEQGDFLFT